MDTSGLEKAVTSLEVGLAAIDDSDFAPGSAERELMRDGVIQRFECAFEQSWRLLKRFLERFGLQRVDSLTNRELFRAGFEHGLLRDSADWLAYLRYRNLMGHSYETEAAETIFHGARAFVSDARFLLRHLQERTRA